MKLIQDQRGKHSHDTRDDIRQMAVHVSPFVLPTTQELIVLFVANTCRVNLRVRATILVSKKLVSSQQTTDIHGLLLSVSVSVLGSVSPLVPVSVHVPVSVLVSVPV